MTHRVVYMRAVRHRATLSDTAGTYPGLPTTGPKAGGTGLYAIHWVPGRYMAGVPLPYPASQP